MENRNFILHYGDLTDSTNLIRIIQQVQPDEIYNLAAMSHVAVSFETPEYTANADGLGNSRVSGFACGDLMLVRAGINGEEEGEVLLLLWPCPGRQVFRPS